MANTKLTVPQALELIEKSMGKNFSEEQKKIILHKGNAPLNVIACAGAGKTTVSIAHMLALELIHQVKPYKILSITFSRKASDEISERYIAARANVSRVTFKPTFKTFHAFFLMLLKQLSKYKHYTVAFPDTYKYNLYKLIKSDGVRDKSDIFDHYMNIRSATINKGYSMDGIEGISDAKSFSEKGVDYDNYVEVVEEYNLLKKKDYAFDFDDMQVMLLQELMDGNEELISKFRETYTNIILDEYQDISPIQNDIMNLLLSPKQIKGLMAIGDDDQSIYAFRGSEPKFIIDFVYNYPNAKRAYLSTNYRCKENILNEVIPMISANSKRVDKKLQAFNEGGKVSYLDISDDEGEKMLLNSLYTDLTNEELQANNIAILVRFNSQRMLLSDRLAEQGIPVDITNERYLLSNNKVYKALMQVVDMVKEENNYLFSLNYYKLGSHIRRDAIEVYKTHRDANWYQDALTGAFDFPKELMDNFKAIKSSDNAYTCLISAWRILKNNFIQMGERGFINIDATLEIVMYVLSLCKDFEGKPNVTYTLLREAEGKKRNFMLACMGEEHALKINTMHSVKGLEYKKVYLYGLTERIVNQKQLKDYYSVQKNAEEVSKAVSEGEYSTNEDTKMSALNIVSSILDYSIEVEEERRVFHVACTRAEDELVLCFDSKKPLALLDEMETFKQMEKIMN